MKQRGLVRATLGVAVAVAVTLGGAAPATAVDTHAGWKVLLGRSDRELSSGGLHSLSNAKRSVATRIPITKGFPAEIAVTPNGSFAFLVGGGPEFGAGTVTPMAVRNGHLGTPLKISAGGDDLILRAGAMSPDGRTLIVSGWQGSDPWSGGVKAFFIDVATRRVVKELFIHDTSSPPGVNQIGIAFTPDGTRAFLVTRWMISVIDVRARTEIRQLFGWAACGTDVAVTPDGKSVYVTNASVWMDEPQHNLVRLDMATLEVTDVIDLPVWVDKRASLAITPNGRTAYVATDDGELVPVDLATKTAGQPIDVGGSLSAVAVTPDGAVAYVTDQTTGRVRAANLLTRTLGPSVLLGSSPRTVAITPDQAPVARFTARKLTTRKVRFDASASTVKYGKVAQYKWKFGDGVTRTTTTPTTTHIYPRRGTYRAVLTAVSSAGTSTVKIFTGKAMLRNGGPSAKVVRTFTLP